MVKQGYNTNPTKTLKGANKSIHTDCQKRRGFRYATAAPLLAAGDAKRYKNRKK